MLRDLAIRNILLIRRIDLEFREGLNVLTGETGTGKSILLDALGFSLGNRARPDLLYAGASQGEVSATFEVPSGHDAHSLLEFHGITMGQEIVLRRTISKTGRSIAYVNDSRCTVDLLREIGELLVNIHGQHDDRLFRSPSSHRKLLDEYAVHHDLRELVKRSWETARSTKKQLEDTRKKFASMASEAEYLVHSLKELDALELVPGEMEDLEKRRRMIKASENILSKAQAARQQMGTSGAVGQTLDAIKLLNSIAFDDSPDLEDTKSAFDRALVELDEGLQNLDVFIEGLVAEPGDLERIEDRIYSIRSLSRKHGVHPDELAEFVKEIQQKLERLDQSESEIVDLERSLVEANRKFGMLADRLTNSRKKAGKKLDRDVGRELVPLRMDKAWFKTEIKETGSGLNGNDLVEFRVSLNPGSKGGSLNRVASGGEMSRLLLALKVCLTSSSTDMCMIFDEIDRGIGGATADAVGRRLLSLAEKTQAIVVTHSPQVAALGRHHWMVSKGSSDVATKIAVNYLDTSGRTNEIARMLAGDRITDEARAAAVVLLRAH